MKQGPEILLTIKKMIVDNEKELKETLADLDRVRKNCLNIRKKVKNKTCSMEDLMVESSKLIVLKDKSMFHEAAIKVLNQILEKIQ